MPVNNAVNNLIYGSTNGVAKTAGQVGEILQVFVPISGLLALVGWGAPQNVTSLVLTPGNWLVHSNATISGSANLITAFISAASLVSATYPDAGQYAGRVGGTATIAGNTNPVLPLSVSVNTTIYLVIYAEGSGGPNYLAGQIIAERQP